MSQFKEIVEGWSNFVFKNKEMESTAEERLKICLECPKYLSVKKKCGVCRCFIPAKVRSETSKCPEKKW